MSVLAILALGFGTTPFGGRIVFTIYCTCNANPTDQYIVVGPPRGGAFMKTSGTKVYDYGNFSVGTWLLGLASGTGVCSIGYEPYCYEITGKKIKMVGTS